MLPGMKVGEAPPNRVPPPYAPPQPGAGESMEMEEVVESSEEGGAPAPPQAGPSPGRAPDPRFPPRAPGAPPPRPPPNRGPDFPPRQRTPDRDTINTQPGRAPTMRTIRDPSARMYYRLYSRQGVPTLQAREPINNADAALSFIRPIVHLAPPYTVENITRVLCNREKVHSSRATLFLTAPRGNNTRPPPLDTVVDVFSETGGCPGVHQNDPMMLVVETSGDPDDIVELPLSAGASCGRWWRNGCIGRSITCLFTCPCDACSVWCEICMEDCQRNFARRPEAH